MTYKKIVEEMLRTDSTEWVNDLLKENEIPYKWVFGCGVEMEKEKDEILYTVLCEIVLENYSKRYVKVGGTVDDILGICHSAIWDGKQKNVIWMNTESGRDALKIKEFKLV